MKKLIVLLAFLSSGLAWGQDYPHYTIEQVDFAPQNYLGLTVFFSDDSFYSSLYKATKFGDTRYGVAVDSIGGSLYFSTFSNDHITFYAATGLAGNIINLQLPSGFYDSNLVCIIEKAVITEYSGVNTYWLCKIIRIEMLDSSGNITRTLIDEAAPTANPLEEAVKAERARWDANGDNKIGIEEAIRALQIVSGTR